VRQQQHHHRPRGLPPAALQLGAQLLDLTAWIFGEHADRAHADHDLAGWWLSAYLSVHGLMINGNHLS
jgi:hypothetical protein